MKRLQIKSIGLLTGYHWIHDLPVTSKSVNNPVRLSLYVCLVEGVPRSFPRGYDVDRERKLVFLNEPPHFLFGSDLAGGIISHNMGYTIRRRGPGSLEDGIVP